MAENRAKNFIDALTKLEAERDLETICALFSEDSDIANVITEDSDRTIDAREFWQKYRDNFGEVKSTFRNQIVAGNTAALEWKTAGTSSEGKKFEYDGVSVLEFEGDRITRFRAYFDPNKLGRQIVEEKGRGA